jgi:hypothetical protein
MAESSIREQIRPELRESFDAWRSLMNTDEGALAAMRGHDRDPVLISESVGGGVAGLVELAGSTPSPATGARSSLIEAEVARVAARYVPATRARIVTVAEAHLGRSETSVREAVAAAMAAEVSYAKGLGLEESIRDRRPRSTGIAARPAAPVEPAPSAHVDLVEGFRQMGLSESAAQAAAKGR